MKRLIVRIGLGIVMGGLLWGGLLANQAAAAVVTFNFTGTVTNILNFPTALSFSPGSPFTVSYTFDDTSLPGDGNSLPGIGTYDNALDTITFKIGSYNVPSFAIPINFVTVSNVPDAYMVNVPVTGSPEGGRTPTRLILDLLGGTLGTTSEAFPTTQPGLAPPFNTALFRVLFDGGLIAGGATVVGTLTAVPLPAAVILFGAGLIALVGLGAGSWRKRNNSLA